MKMFTMALAATIMFASCSKESDGVEAKDLQLLVKIASVKLDTKATTPENAAEAKEASFDDGVIFICDDQDNIERIVDIVKSEITGNGQVISEKVFPTTKVYVVANIPAAVISDWKAKLSSPGLTITDVNATAHSIYADEFGKDYLKATLANSDGSAKAIQVTTGNNAEVNITLSPVYTRIELHKIHSKVTTQGTDEVTTFTVKGVYLDGFCKNYTVGAGGTESHSMGQDIAKAIPEMSIVHGTTGWASTTQSPYEAVVDPLDVKQIWGHNLPSVATPKLVIALTDVVGSINGNPINSSDTYYLTVRSYKEGTTDVTAFERGNVYRIADLEFEAEHLGTTPNAANIDLTVKVQVAKWVLKDVTGGM